MEIKLSTQRVRTLSFNELTKLREWANIKMDFYHDCKTESVGSKKEKAELNHPLYFNLIKEIDDILFKRLFVEIS